MTIRETVMAEAIEEAQLAAFKSHETMYSTLYADRDGEVSWGEEIDSNSRRRYEDGESVAVIWSGGTGSIACNCDDCAKGIDPAEWVDDCDGTMADMITAKIAELYLGYFDDEDED